MASTPDDQANRPANEGATEQVPPVTPPPEGPGSGAPTPDGGPTAGTQPGATPPTGDADRSVTELVFDVGERVSLLVREEVQLAKAEVTEKLTTLGRGAGVGIAAGVFLIAALMMLLHAFAWFLNDIFGFTEAVWLGFLIEAIIWIIVAVIAALVAKKLLEDSSPPVPEMAIEEAQKTKETLEGKG